MQLLQIVLSSLARMYSTNISNHVTFLIMIFLHYAPSFIHIKGRGSPSRIQLQAPLLTSLSSLFCSLCCTHAALLAILQNSGPSLLPIPSVGDFVCYVTMGWNIFHLYLNDSLVFQVSCKCYPLGEDISH